jgi:hypothetical protein
VIFTSKYLMYRSNEDYSWEVRVCTIEFGQLSFTSIDKRWLVNSVDNWSNGDEISSIPIKVRTSSKSMRVDERWQWITSESYQL